MATALKTSKAPQSRRSPARARMARRPGGVGGTGGITNIDEIDWLSGIIVRRLEATPTEIPAFGSATIFWDVDAGPPVRLTLGGMRVLHDGSMVIHPTQSNVYRLFAFAGNDSRDLGQVRVDVLLDQCVRRASSNIDELLAGALMQGVQQSGNLYFRLERSGSGFQPSKPIVTISEGRIDFKMKLAAEVDWLPNPDVDVRGSFGLAIEQLARSANSLLPQTVLVPSNINVDVDVSFPWYTYAIPGAAIGLPIAESGAEDSAKAAFTEGVKTFVDHLNFVAPAPGLIKHGVRIYVDSDGFGTVEVEFCPRPEPGIGLGNL